MKDTLSSLDLHFLVEELQWLVEAKADKIYSRENVYLFSLHKAGVGKVLLKFMLPQAMFVTESKEEFDQPDNFATALRKYLGGARLVRIEQKGFERVVELGFENKGKETKVYAELFSKGNLILCDQENRIINAYQFQKWSSRIVRGGGTYVFPSRQYDLKSMGIAEFSKFLDSTKKSSIVVALATDLGLGGDYAEYLCSLAGIEKSKQSLDQAEKERLFEASRKLFVLKTTPTISADGFDVLGLAEGKTFGSVNHMLDEFFTSVLVGKYKAGDAKVQKQLAIIKQQEQHLKGLQEEAAENQKKADALYGSYQEVSQIISYLKQDPNYRHKKILSVDKSKQEATLELE